MVVTTGFDWVVLFSPCNAPSTEDGQDILDMDEAPPNVSAPSFPELGCLLRSADSLMMQATPSQSPS